MRFEFEKAEHSDYGSEVWRLVGHPNFDPLAGMAVAHDCLEHFPGDVGTIDQEFMALGASYVVRDGDCYYHHRGGRYRAPENVSADMPTLITGLLGGQWSLEAPPKTKPLSDSTEEDFVVEVFNETLKLFKSELPDIQIDEKDKHLVTLFMTSIVPWFRIGLRRAKKRYRDVPTFQLCHMFATIEKEADSLLKRAESYQRLHVNVSLKNRDVEIRLKDIEEDFYDG